MTKDNLRLWKQFADIDPQHTKPITGKPYKGTSPKPQYMIQLLTEMFGPVGEGFGWLVVADGFQPLGEEILHWCRINFWWRDSEGACNSFEAYGQTKAYMKTKSGLMMDEDAPKKSLTDAITKAASQIGIASNLFMGRWDDSRYVEEVNREFREAEKQAAEPPPFNPAAAAQRLLVAVNRCTSVTDLKELKAQEGDTLSAIKAVDMPTFKMVAAAMSAAFDKLNVPFPPAIAEAVGEVPEAFHG